MASILDFAAKHRLTIVEDAAQALGAEYASIEGKTNGGSKAGAMG